MLVLVAGCAGFAYRCYGKKSCSNDGEEDKGLIKGPQNPVLGPTQEEGPAFEYRELPRTELQQRA